jgi:hypothetical protein
MMLMLQTLLAGNGRAVCGDRFVGWKGRGRHGIGRSMVADDVVVTGSLRLEARDVALGWRALLRRVWLVVAFCTVTVSVLLLWRSHDALVFLVPPVVFFALFSYFLWRAMRRGRDQALANVTDAERDVTFRFDGEGVEIESGGGTWQFNWAGIHRFREGRDTFLLFTTEAVVHLVPKRALSADRVDVVRSMLTERIRPRRRSIGMVIGYTPRRAIRTVLLWALLILMFLACWQLLMPPGGR